MPWPYNFQGIFTRLSTFSRVLFGVELKLLLRLDSCSWLTFPFKNMAAVAQMDLVKDGNRPIPLRCVLCPKQPSFSDVSHLLTHISSKSHLAHRFKVEIRSQKDEDARERLFSYDTWYYKYGIQGLLADRMVAKDKKKASKRVRVPVGRREPSGTLKQHP